jgi:membrane associated rhomboid family serine protease
MGIYDRDYYREGQPGLRLGWPRSVTTAIVLVNVAIYLVDYVLLKGQIAEALCVHVGTLTRPLEWWQFLTYGFIHAKEPQHVVFNMLGLWFFGRWVEETYGPKEFLRVYLVLLVFGSLVWALTSKFVDGAPDFGSPLIGASGAVVGIVILFALNYPRVQVLFFFVLPMPAWVLGILLVAQDMWGAMHRGGSDHVAYTVHLAGAFFAILYYQLRWNLGRLLPGPGRWRWLKRRGRMRVHTPEDEDKRLSDEVDRILAKISLEGEASLTGKERRALKNASRRFQEKRQSADEREE